MFLNAGLKMSDDDDEDNLDLPFVIPYDCSVFSVTVVR